MSLKDRDDLAFGAIGATAAQQRFTIRHSRGKGQSL
jgi:hypothetical protein